MDLAYDSSRFRSYYADEPSRDSDRMSTDYYRGDSRGLSKSTYRDVRGSGGRDREYASYDREFDRGPKRYSSTSKEGRDPYDDYVYGQSSRNSDRGSSSQAEEYRTLCLSNLNDRIPDSTIKEAINQEFKQFGDFNVKLVHAGEHRIAYVNFRYPGDAREAKRARTNKLFLFDLVTRIDAVYPKRRADSPEFSGSSGYGRDPYNKGVSPQARMSASGRHDDMDADGKNRDYNRRGYDNKMQDGQKHHEHKFPHHLHHIQPEDDDKATRTLFVGNLDIAITDADLRDVFERYGEVEDIDIKRPAKGQGNAYAFVKFNSLDMAHRAKVDMSGRYVGKLQCKIGYGKVNPTNCVWVGGLGPWISTASLEAEFDRFGVIHRVFWPDGKNFAYLLYDSRDAAQAACRAMRGFPLGGSDRRLRVDFADPTVAGGTSIPADTRNDQTSQRPSTQPLDSDAGKHNNQDTSTWQNKGYYGRGTKVERSDRAGTDFRSPDGGMPRDDFYRRRDEVDNISDVSDKWKHSKNRHDEDPAHRAKPATNYPPNYSPSRDRHDRDGRTSPNPKRQRVSGSGDPYNSGVYEREHANSNGNYGDRQQHGEAPLFDTEPLISVQTVEEMAKNLPVVWSGALVLKTSAFSTRMHLVSGNVRLVDTLMRDHTTTEMSLLKITQRLRLDQPKLEDMGRRVSSSGPHGYSILLAMPGSETALEDANTKIQHRPLKNLVSYLKQKEAAGVISLPPNSSKEQELGVLHAFPPCHFGQEYLQRKAPKIGLEPSKEDHLVVIVVGGSA